MELLGSAFICLCNIAGVISLAATQCSTLRSVWDLTPVSTRNERQSSGVHLMAAAKCLTACVVSSNMCGNTQGKNPTSVILR